MLGFWTGQTEKVLLTLWDRKKDIDAASLTPLQNI
jgi:hypothetical protein